MTDDAAGLAPGRLPDFLILGAAKSGTTSLLYVLAAVSSEAWTGLPWMSTSVPIVSSAAKNWPPSGIHGRGWATSMASAHSATRSLVTMS